MIRCARTLLLLSVLLVAVATPVVVRAQQWIEPRPSGAGYRIEFPMQPTLLSQDVTTGVGPVKLNIAQVEIGDTIAFLAMHNMYPRGTINNANVALNQARDGAVGNTPGGKLRSDRNLTVSGASARLIAVEALQERRVLTSLMVVRGDSLYQAIVVTPEGGENSADGQRFISSLALVPR